MRSACLTPVTRRRTGSALVFGLLLGFFAGVVAAAWVAAVGGEQTTRPCAPAHFDGAEA